MSDIHYVRLFFPQFAGGNLTFGWRDALRCQKVYEELRNARREYHADNGEVVSPLFEIADDFGNTIDVDLRVSFALLRTSGQQNSELNNALRLSGLKGEMHMEALIRQDEKLATWVMRRQGQGLVIPPHGTGNA